MRQKVMNHLLQVSNLNNDSQCVYLQCNHCEYKLKLTGTLTIINSLIKHHDKYHNGEGVKYECKISNCPFDKNIRPQITVIKLMIGRYSCDYTSTKITTLKPHQEMIHDLLSILVSHVNIEFPNVAGAAGSTRAHLWMIPAK